MCTQQHMITKKEVGTRRNKIVASSEWTKINTRNYKHFKLYVFLRFIRLDSIPKKKNSTTIITYRGAVENRNAGNKKENADASEAFDTWNENSLLITNFWA